LKSRRLAQDWYDERRYALLIVPSIPARLERNILINPAHPEEGHHLHDA
jgi:RES domain-containing protein